MHLDHANSSLFNMEYLDFGQVQFLREEIESRTGPLDLPLQHTANRMLEASVHDKGEDCSGVDMRERHSGRENRLDLLEIRDPSGGPGKKLQIVTRAVGAGSP